MAQLIKKIKCKFVAADEYKPDEISRDRWMPVIGIESRKKEFKRDDKPSVFGEEFFFLVIDDKGKLRTIASFNCQTMIDDNAEINPGQLMRLLENIAIIGKVLSEKIAGFPDKTNGQNG